MNDTKTIFALASAAGKAGVSVFRISGAHAEFALRKLGIDDKLEPRKAYLRRLKKDNGSVIDEALVIYFENPHSFTGEDIVELHLHGSLAVVTDLTEYLSSFSEFRMAEAGEFSRRAFENGKLDLTRLEGLADLIDSETKLQQKQALRQLSGELEKLYESFREELLAILVNIEAYIDFPDEEIPDHLDLAAQEQVQNLVTSLKDHVNDRRGEILRNGIHAVILGAPNVGKSSLMNYLAKRDVAIVSNIAGTTRDIIEIHLDINGLPITLSDTAGIREASDEIESLGINIALKKAEDADLKIIIFDAETYPDLDQQSLNLIDDNSIILLNKSDLMDNNGSEIVIGEQEAISISIFDKTGMDKLISALENAVADKISPSSNPLFTRERHKQQINESIENLERFITNRTDKIDIELCAEDLRLASNALGKITGKIDVEEILGKIFSSFCIGK